MKKMQGIADRTNFNRAGTHQVNTLYCPKQPKKQPKWQIRPKIPDYEKCIKRQGIAIADRTFFNRAKKHQVNTRPIQ